ncbi:hypothetical protein HKK52_26875 [Pseudomonas sp. ADAK2]|uniref:hypothetical protein n=1 Tax=Pseudomonas TaxID=286 RepID=UPI0014638F61|nr:MULTISPECIES: hypothetical protein [unclassified Pseudomonas]QJI44429.1 hypothetical protein HKK53_26875 [Pseudomonas sp. ADAK7]QJI50730.1 hypothetical protein HKK52_26875 [Pseudomonas sp. ADAK2]
MSFFKSKNAIAGVEPVITVSAETVAKVSNRVNFNTQIVEFDADTNSNLIALVSRANTQDYSHRSKKGLVLIFDKNINSGTYSVTDQDFPFDQAYYFETGTIPGLTTSFEYEPKSGSFNVEVIQNTPEKLHYQISFDFKGVDKRNEELKVVGTSTFIVLMRPV